MERLAFLGLVLWCGCGSRNDEQTRPGRELARLPGTLVQLAGSREYLIAKVTTGQTGERGRPVESLTFISLSDGATQPSSELVSGQLVADARGAYWGDSDGRISRLDPARATLTPFANVDRAVERSPRQQRLAVGVGHA